jgi:hypothetical protein
MGGGFPKGLVGVPYICRRWWITLFVVIDDQLGGIGTAGGKGVYAQRAKIPAKAFEIL